MKRFFHSIAFCLALSTMSYAQTLFVPSGTGGIGSSAVSGNVGIGISNPMKKFVVKSTQSNISQFFTSSPNAHLYIENGAQKGLTIGRLTNSTDGDYAWISGNTGNFSGFYAEIVMRNGDVGIGTLNPTHRLSVNGTIRAKEIIVNTNWADFVFEEGYKLRPLEEVESFIKENKHLPDMPAASAVQENGVSLGEANTLLLQKLEELTLYMIGLNKEVKNLQDENNILKHQLSNQHK